MNQKSTTEKCNNTICIHYEKRINMIDVISLWFSLRYLTRNPTGSNSGQCGPWADAGAWRLCQHSRVRHRGVHAQANGAAGGEEDTNKRWILKLAMRKLGTMTFSYSLLQNMADPASWSLVGEMEDCSKSSWTTLHPLTSVCDKHYSCKKLVLSTLLS